MDSDLLLSFLPQRLADFFYEVNSIMVEKYIIALFFLFSFWPGISAWATDDNKVTDCRRLDEKASGDMAKYSLHAYVDGPVFFSGISCAIAYRNKELCAMEMIGFDTTAKVLDYYTGEEIEIGKAYFWLNENNNKTPITAFVSQESAGKYKADTGNGIILDYSALINRKFN